jgi:hypothetical protein
MSKAQRKPEDGLIDRLAGNGGAMLASGAVMRYVAGAIRRERQRLAEIFERGGMQEIAMQIADSSLDANVFRFRPPSVDLHTQTSEPLDAQPGTMLVVGNQTK